MGWGSLATPGHRGGRDPYPAPTAQPPPLLITSQLVLLPKSSDELLRIESPPWPGPGLTGGCIACNASNALWGALPPIPSPPSVFCRTGCGGYIACHASNARAPSQPIPDHRGGSKAVSEAVLEPAALKTKSSHLITSTKPSCLGQSLSS